MPVLKKEEEKEELSRAYSKEELGTFTPRQRLRLGQQLLQIHNQERLRIKLDMGILRLVH